MNPIILVIIFIAATLVGYMIIKSVPSLLHTPLMSGMNALSGITVLGAFSAVLSVKTGSKALGFAALILAMLNVVGGFGVTHRMLKMFKRDSGKDKNNGDLVSEK